MNVSNSYFTDIISLNNCDKKIICKYFEYFMKIYFYTAIFKGIKLFDLEHLKSFFENLNYEADNSMAIYSCV